MSLFRRRSRPSTAPVRDVAEAEVAVGSLTGIPPSDIERHLLVVVEKSGRVTLSGTTCREATVLVLSELLAQLTREAYAAHECGGGHGH